MVRLRKDASSFTPGFTFGDVGPHLPVAFGGGPELEEALEWDCIGGEPGGVSNLNCCGRFIGRIEW